jgi:hypothetical protein
MKYEYGIIRLPKIGYTLPQMGRRDTNGKMEWATSANGWVWAGSKAEFTKIEYSELLKTFEFIPDEIKKTQFYKELLEDT